MKKATLFLLFICITTHNYSLNSFLFRPLKVTVAALSMLSTCPILLATYCELEDNQTMEKKEKATMIGLATLITVPTFILSLRSIVVKDDLRSKGWFVPATLSILSSMLTSWKCNDISTTITDREDKKAFNGVIGTLNIAAIVQAINAITEIAQPQAFVE
jgi:hypothetical protein